MIITIRVITLLNNTQSKCITHQSYNQILLLQKKHTKIRAHEIIIPTFLLYHNAK